MRIGICDDLQEDRNHLIALIRDYYNTRGERVELFEYESAEEMLGGWRDNWLGCLFLDVYMDGISGMEAARRIRETDSNCMIIFTTTSPDHAIDSYEVRAADYLLKPFDQPEVEEALRWCEEVSGQRLRELEIISERERRSVPVRDILYIEVYGRMCVIHLAEEELRTNRGLGELEEELADDSFLRCHRSYLVNMAHILRPEGRDFLLSDHSRVPIAAENAGRVRQAFFEWSFKQTWESK